MLFRRYNAALLPLIQSSDYGHEAFVLRMWGDASGAGHSMREPFRRSMNLPIVHCNRLAAWKMRSENTGWCAGNNHKRPSRFSEGAEGNGEGYAYPPTSTQL